MANICPICFDDLNLEGKEKASPDACDHVFCLPCLEKWSKLGSYCPVDRKRYKKIVNLDSESVIQIKPRKRKRKRVVYDFSTTCEVCNTDEDPDTLLLCDCCDLGFHCYCLTPPLDTVPAGLWFCPTCVTVEQKLKQRKGITKEMELDYDIFLQKLNYYEPASPQTKKQKVPSPRKSGGVQDTCNDIISVFEDINVVPDSGTNVKTDLNAPLETDAKTLSSKSSPEKPIKGTFSIFSDAFAKSAYLDERSGLDLCTKNAQSKNEEKFQFSVFEGIEDIDSSQKKYNIISTRAHISVSSEANLDHCSLCKDIISFASQKLCKICRKKNLKEHSSVLKSEELLKCTKESKSCLSGLNSNYKTSQNVLILGNSKKISFKSCMSSLEKRQHSLLRELRKIQTDKWKSASSK